jgi:hypothetical protein
LPAVELMRTPMKAIYGQLGEQLSDTRTGAIRKIMNYRPTPVILGYVAVSQLGHDA